MVVHLFHADVHVTLSIYLPSSLQDDRENISRQIGVSNGSLYLSVSLLPPASLLSQSSGLIVPAEDHFKLSPFDPRFLAGEPRLLLLLSLLSFSFSLSLSSFSSSIPPLYCLSFRFSPTPLLGFERGKLSSLVSSGMGYGDREREERVITSMVWDDSAQRTGEP